MYSALLNHGNQSFLTMTNNDAVRQHLVSTWLIDNRKKFGMTQEMVAEKADIHPTYVSKIELGQKVPSRKVVFRLAAALTPEDASSLTRNNILNEALTASGYFYHPAGSTREEREEEDGYWAAFKSLPPDRQNLIGRMIKAAADEVEQD